MTALTALALRTEAPATDPVDQALLEAIAAGDRAAFGQFHRRHYRRLFRFLLRVTGDPARVEEALNDTMLAVWQGASDFGGRSRVLTWLFGIAWRQARKAERRDRRWRAMEPIDDLPLADPRPLEEALETADLKAKLEAGFAQLTPAHRAVVELTYYSGCDLAEVAAILDCPVGTVKTRLFHARARLRAVLGVGGPGSGTGTGTGSG